MKQLLKKRLLFVFIFSGIFSVCSQNTAHSVIGEVKDATDQSAIAYGTVMVLDSSTNQVLQATSTNGNGVFNFTTSTSNFYVKISFIGYKTEIVKKIDVSKSRVNLGTILLQEDAQALEAVEIRAEISKTQFKLDKKVFNVGKDIASTGVSALEVLNNVPSVNVNIEGEVSLRGDTGVQILIDGKPSILSDDSSNVFGTITADMIESIEVITNPSAKYDAEGTAGILNIVLKKEEKRGINGSVSVNTGHPDNHSVGVSLNKRTEKFNLFTQFGGGYKSYPRNNENINRNKINNTELISIGENYRNEKFYNLILGTDYHINDYNVLTLSGNFAYEIEDQPSDTDYDYYQDDVLDKEWNRKGVTDATNPKWQYDLSYKKDFKNHKDHTLLISALGRFFGKDLTSEFINTTISGDVEEVDQQISTDFQQQDFTFKIDYTNPLTEQVIIETGSQYVINDVGNDYEVKNYENDEFVTDQDLTNNFEYIQKVFAFYGTGGYQADQWGLKLGLRIENTDLYTLLTNTDEENTQKYTDFFPSAHASFKANDDFSLQTGYSRRIYRPRLWDLNPFFNIQDSYNIRTGNPNLLPEYTDSYEITGIYEIRDLSLSSSIYYRFTTDIMERISIFSDNITTTTPYNIGTKKTTGVEVNGKYTPIKWLTFNGDLNWNYFDREGSYEDDVFDFSGDKWTTRLNSKISFPLDIDMEITGNYSSKYKTLQGETSGFGHADLGLRKKLLQGKAVVNVAVRDVFESRISESEINNDTVYQYSFGQRGRFITLGFSYGFGKGEAMTYSGKRR